jgi:outer membrane protein TolC
MRPLESKSLLITVVVAGLTGCAPPSFELAPAAPDRPWRPQTSTSGDIVPGPPHTAIAAAREGYTLPRTTALSSVPPAVALDASHPYTLPELIDLAESSNPSTRIAWNDARNAALAADISEAAYLPQLTATAMGGFQTAHDTTSTRLGSLAADPNAHGAIGILGLQWLLFDFGGRRAGVDAAKELSVAANIVFTAAHQQVIHDVSVAYYAYQATRSRARTARQALDNADGILAAARARLAQGIGTVIEVAQATQNRAQANLAIVQTEGTESGSYLGLISALGISPLSKPTIAELPVRVLSPTLERSVDEIVADAIARRPDVQGAYALAKASQAKIRAAEATFKPKVFMSASVANSTGNTSITATPSIGNQSGTVNLNGNRYGGSLFFGVSIPLYDGGLRSTLLKQAHNDADSASARLDRTKEDAVRQIVVSQNLLRTGLASHDAAKGLVDASQTSYDAAFAAYKSGVGSVTDVLLAQNQLFVAQNAYADSYSVALSAAATLALATGAMEEKKTPW